MSAIPFFLLAILLLSIFAVELRSSARGGFDPIMMIRFNLASIVSIVYHAILPSMALVLGGIGAWALGMRAMMVSTLGEDYITFAEAKGLPPRRIFLWYGLRNALLPQMTHLAIALGSILSGAVLVEAMFSYPGPRRPAVRRHRRQGLLRDPGHRADADHRAGALAADRRPDLPADRSPIPVPERSE